MNWPGLARARVAATLLALAFAPCALGTSAHAEATAWSRLALAMPDPGRDGWLAQRTIEREWGPSEDSLYHVVDIPGYKSEGWAMAMSAAVPGTGQLYVGEHSGWLWLLTDVVGWAGRALAQHKADRYSQDVANVVGSPYDSTSGWSFTRWQQATGGDPSYLASLWGADREAYYHALATDPQYLSGFSGSAPNTYAAWLDLRGHREDAVNRVQLVEDGLWIEHLASALDALRAVRFHNLPLRQQYQLQLGEGWSRGRPELRAAVVRRF